MTARMQPLVTITAWLRGAPISLMHKLIILMTAVIWLVLLGQTLVWLSSEITDMDQHVLSDGTIVAQSVATSTVALLEQPSETAFASLFDRLDKTIDVVEVVVSDRTGKVLASRKRPGRGLGPTQQFGAFRTPRQSPGLAVLLGESALYEVSAPIARGSEIVGNVNLVFRSAVLAERSVHLTAVALAMAMLWMLIGSGLASVYVRRITKPLAELGKAAEDVAEGKLDAVSIAPTSRDEIGKLQYRFGQLVTALKEQRADNAELLDKLQQQSARLRQRVDEVTAELRETARYLESVFRAMEEGVLTCDLAGEIVQVNQSAGRQLACLSRPEPGVHLAQLVPNGESLWRTVEEVIHTRKGRIFEITCLCTKSCVECNGQPHACNNRQLSIHAYPLLGQGNRSLGAVLIVTDVTDERQLEERLRRHDRLISLGTIAAGLAHELGNVMHAIQGFGMLLARATPDDDPRAADIAAIRSENQRGVQLLDRFLQFARPGHTRFGDEDLGGLVHEALGMCGYRLRSSAVLVEATIAENLGEIRCDGRQLVQVLVNLLLNALDALDGVAKPVLQVSASRDANHHAQIRITDNGCGIASEHLDRIFDPFFTTKEGTGTGLGLSIAHQIIALHGGQLGVESQLGVGTTFTIDLPIDGPQQEAP
ncbi:MAG: HAMP domain-containing protein [Deltaproteobacteria bacterium]|nr:HAMP domain-containing protein [Deltaproteobacteria bacterium]